MKKTTLLDTATTPDGRPMTLLAHDADRIIRVDGVELMSTRQHHSEERLGELACAGLTATRGARVLIGGLGMGFTLRAVLRSTAADAEVVVAEIIPAVVRWNRDPAQGLGAESLADALMRNNTLKTLLLGSNYIGKAGATRLLHAYAVRVGIKIMDRLQEFCKQNHKELMVLLSYPVGAVWHACNRSSSDDPDNTDWHPQYFKDHLAERGIRMVDSLPAHVTEFDSFRLSAKEYVDRYYIGHYTPRGNHFFAYANKDAIRNWLNPPPPAYQNNQEPLIRFKGYLPG